MTTRTEFFGYGCFVGALVTAALRDGATLFAHLMHWRGQRG